MEKKRNPFKANNLKQNNRWSGFQKTIIPTEIKPLNSRFKQFNSFTTQDNNNRNERRKFGEKRGKFGKRIYRSKYNKEETLNYFNTQKTATVKETSLFNFLKTETKKNKKEKNKNDVNNNELFAKSEMTEAEKKFITNQYMYEDESDEENDDNTEEKNEKISKIIEF